MSQAFISFLPLFSFALPVLSAAALIYPAPTASIPTAIGSVLTIAVPLAFIERFIPRSRCFDLFVYGFHIYFFLGAAYCQPLINKRCAQVLLATGNNFSSCP
jgi:hypothetical protein